MLKKICAFLFLILVIDAVCFSMILVLKEKYTPVLKDDVPSLPEGVKQIAAAEDKRDAERKQGNEQAVLDSAMVAKGVSMRLAEPVPAEAKAEGLTPRIRYYNQIDLLFPRVRAFSILSTPEHIACWRKHGGTTDEFLKTALKEPDLQSAEILLRGGCFVFEDDARFWAAYEKVLQELDKYTPRAELEDSRERLSVIRFWFAAGLMPLLLLLTLFFFFRGGKGWLVLVILNLAAVISFVAATRVQYSFEEKIYPLMPYLKDGIGLPEKIQTMTPQEKLKLLYPEDIVRETADGKLIRQKLPTAGKTLTGIAEGEKYDDLCRWIRSLDEAGKIPPVNPLDFIVKEDGCLHIIHEEKPIAVYPVPAELKP